MIVPCPWQRGHGCDMANGPWLRATMPRPWHSGQTLGVVPGFAPLPWQVSHVSALSTGTRTVTPFSESSNDTVTSACRSSPRSAALRRPRPAPPAAPPNRLPRMSPRSPIVELGAALCAR